MTVVYIVCGILLYFLVAGITTAILGKALPEDAELLAIFLSAMWPLALPVYILGQVFGIGRTLTEKLLNRNLKSTDK